MKIRECKAYHIRNLMVDFINGPKQRILTKVPAKEAQTKNQNKSKPQAKEPKVKAQRTQPKSKPPQLNDPRLIKSNLTPMPREIQHKQELQCSSTARPQSYQLPSEECQSIKLGRPLLQVNHQNEAPRGPQLWKKHWSIP